jgi:hypothetical protein
MVEDLIKRLYLAGRHPDFAICMEAAARIAELEAAIRKQANAARSLADATIRDASIRQGLAEKAYAESSPEVLASERQANAMLTEENDRLTARLTALESERDALLAAAGKDAVAEVVGSQEICWVRVTSNGLKPGDKLYTAPTAALEKSSDALYTMDQMRDYALAFHKSRLDARGDLTAKQKWDIAKRVHSQCEALKPHATFRSAASQAINDTIAALSQKAGEQQ